MCLPSPARRPRGASGDGCNGPVRFRARGSAADGGSASDLC
eukprot:CAMPEP_0177511700 /NCGR_PEP_ID=MMETSP0369-20130122/42821_1 /TAXON_ID=447022 ORGANISM="Scrippsiella hangoei-like, Strain SHHI-4" /NCGR_SAMPLE_ID=MMETSP0369 /ASSEMBLY_ACC=CAM_ASM_000364 /LENGTH=40 /DNA_ID= /DNA_START= /DNA_END= /DNA_ORIENTATION=